MTKDDIKKLRESLLMTQAEFGDELGVAESTVNRWEKGKRTPRFTYIKLMKALQTANTIRKKV